MASLVCQSSLFSLEFFNSARTPKRKRVPLRVKNRRDAESIRRKLERDHTLGTFDPWTDDPRTYDRVVSRPDRLGEAHAAFVDAKSHKAARTVSDYRKIVGRFVEFVGAETFVCHLTPQDVERWLDSTDAGDVTRQTYVRNVKVFLRWAKKEGLTAAVVTDAVRLRRVPNKFPRFLSPEEVEQIVTTIRRDARSAHWLADLIVFGVHTGLRRGELVSLRWDAVDFAAGVLTVACTEAFSTKSGSERKVPLSSAAIAALERRRDAAAGRSDGRPGYVFTCGNSESGQITPDYLSQAFKRWARLAGIPDVHLHHLRHTACSWLAQKGVPVEAIRRFAGHSTITVTERYCHVGDDLFSTAILKAFG